jgi:hypothetical protein
LKYRFFSFLLLTGFIVLTGCKQSSTGPNSSGWLCATQHAPFAARYGIAGTVFNNEIWVIGGAQGSGANNSSVTTYYGDIWHSPNGSSWTVANGNPPFGKRYGAQALSFGGKIWLIGGNNEGTVRNDVWSSSDGVTWQQVTTNPSLPNRVDFGAIVFNGAMWIMGGWGGSYAMNDVWTSADGTNWTNVGANPVFERRWGFALTSYNNALWVITGAKNGPSPTEGYGDVWTSPNGVSWTQVSNAKLSKIYYGGAAVANNEIWLTMGIYIYGGHAIALTDTPQPDTCTTIDGINWFSSTSPYQARFNSLNLSFQNQAWVIGGCGYQKQGATAIPVYFNDVWHSP